VTSSIIARRSTFGHLQPIFGQLEPISLVHAVAGQFSGVPTLFRLAAIAIGAGFDHLTDNREGDAAVPDDGYSEIKEAANEAALLFLQRERLLRRATYEGVRLG